MSSEDSRKKVPPFVAYAQMQKNWDARHPPDPASVEKRKERLRKIKRDGLPFFPKSFARYTKAQKNYDRKKAEKKAEKKANATEETYREE